VKFGRVVFFRYASDVTFYYYVVDNACCCVVVVKEVGSFVKKTKTCCLQRGKKISLNRERRKHPSVLSFCATDPLTLLVQVVCCI